MNADQASGLARRRQSASAWIFLATSLVAVVVFLALDSPEVSIRVYVSIALGASLAIIVGIRRNNPAEPVGWWCVLAASIGFLCSDALRSAVIPMADLPRGLFGAGFAIAGYAALGVAGLRWARARPRGDYSKATLDMALGTLALLVLSWMLIISPALRDAGDAGGTRVEGMVYPALDLVVIALVTHLASTSDPGNRSMRLLQMSLVGVFIGDLGHMLTPDEVAVQNTLFLDAPYLVGYGFLGAAALHPSMATVFQRHPAGLWIARRRLVVVASVVLVAVFSPVVLPAPDTPERVIRATIIALILFGVLVRSAQAIRHRAESEARVRHTSTEDELTGLPNRAGLHESVLLTPGVQRISLLLLVISDFTLINDSYGHRVGDELIVAAADRLKCCVGTSGVVHRYGGDEFVVVTGLGRTASEELANRILHSFDEPYALSTGRVFAETSIGIGRRGQGRWGPSDLDDLLREADSAMYYAKSTRSGGYAFFEDKPQALARDELETATALRDAIAKDEFELYYQPVVDVAYRTVVGYEALLRWHRDGRTCTPAEFILVAEASDIINDIGEWVVDSACTQLARWWSRGSDRPHIAVNISARHLRDDGLVNLVVAALQRTGLPPSALWIEITETAVIDDTGAAREVLEKLRAVGVEICVDDFGTGQSSLSHLARLPITVLKIDRAFVELLGKEPADEALVRGIEAMARALGFRTVVEGVETQLQESVIKSIGCGLAQGWRYGRPLPAGELDRRSDGRQQNETVAIPPIAY